MLKSDNHCVRQINVGIMRADLRMSLLGCVQESKESKRSMACPPVAKSILPPTVGPDRYIYRETDKGKEEIT